MTGKHTRYRFHSVGCGVKGLTEERLEAARNAPDREPCTFCGVKAEVGCRHKTLVSSVYLSDMGDTPRVSFREGLGSARAGTSPLDRPAAFNGKVAG